MNSNLSNGAVTLLLVVLSKKGKTPNRESFLFYSSSELISGSSSDVSASAGVIFFFQRIPAVIPPATRTAQPATRIQVPAGLLFSPVWSPGAPAPSVGMAESVAISLPAGVVPAVGAPLVGASAGEVLSGAGWVLTGVWVPPEAPPPWLGTGSA